MKYRKHLSLIQKSQAFVMICLVMLAGCGVSYNLHFCHNTLAATTLFPGFTNAVKGCGCESSVHPSISGELGTAGTALHKTDCCKNLKFYTKITTNSFNDFSKGMYKGSGDFLAEKLPFSLHSSIEQSIVSPIILYHPPPPVSGRLLVYYIHQLRIPSLSGDC